MVLWKDKEWLKISVRIFQLSHKWEWKKKKHLLQIAREWKWSKMLGNFLKIQSIWKIHTHFLWGHEF